jgi:hypothetical protein
MELCVLQDLIRALQWVFELVGARQHWFGIETS